MYELDKKQTIACKCTIEEYEFYGNLKTEVNSLKLELYTKNGNPALDEAIKAKTINGIIIPHEGKGIQYFTAIVKNIPGFSASGDNNIRTIIISLKLLLYIPLDTCKALDLGQAQFFEFETAFQLEESPYRIPLPSLPQSENGQTTPIAEITLANNHRITITHNTKKIEEGGDKKVFVSSITVQTTIDAKIDETLDLLMQTLQFYTIILQREVKPKWITLLPKDPGGNEWQATVLACAIMPVKECNNFCLSMESAHTNYISALLKEEGHFESVAKCFFEKITTKKEKSSEEKKRMKFKACVKGLYEVIDDYQLFNNTNLMDILFIKAQKALGEFAGYMGGNFDKIFNKIEDKNPQEFHDKNSDEHLKDIRQESKATLNRLKKKYKAEDKTIGSFITGVRGAFLHFEEKGMRKLEDEDLKPLADAILSLLILEVNEELGMHKYKEKVCGIIETILDTQSL